MIVESYSQSGEDLVVDAILKRIGTRNQVCLECGAGDGKYLSNTYRFGRLGWWRILVEQDVRNFLDGRAAVLPKDRWVCRTCTDLDAVLSVWCVSLGSEIDFVSIDVDGQDYWLWHDLVGHRPRVVCIEFSGNPTQATHIPARGEASVYEEGTQAGIDALRSLAASKHYKEAAVVGVNVIFVAEEALPKPQPEEPA